MGIYNFAPKLSFLNYKWRLMRVLFKMEIFLGIFYHTSALNLTWLGWDWLLWITIN